MFLTHSACIAWYLWPDVWLKKLKYLPDIVLIFTAIFSHMNANKLCLHLMLLSQQHKSLLIFRTQEDDHINCLSLCEEDLQPSIIHTNQMNSVIKPLLVMDHN